VRRGQLRPAQHPQRGPGRRAQPRAIALHHDTPRATAQRAAVTG
jgi:hypothetical protein